MRADLVACAPRRLASAAVLFVVTPDVCVFLLKFWADIAADSILLDLSVVQSFLVVVFQWLETLY